MRGRPFPGNLRTRKGTGLPPSLAPLARNSFTPPCRGRACPARSLAITTPFILCIVGRGLDRLTAHNERRQPAKLARSCGCLPCRGKHCSLPDFAPLNRGPTLTTPHLHGAWGRRPLQHNPQGFSLPQTSAAAWGQAALLYHIPWGGPSPATHSRHPVGAGHARPATLPLPPRILCIVGRQATGPLHNRPAPSNTKITCLRPLAGRLFFRSKFFSVPFLLRKGTNPRLVKITSGQSPQPRRPAPAGPAGSARPSCR